MIFLTRRETFSAAHRLHSPLLGDDENRQLYGKCNWPGGHGHNYVLQVTVAGELDPRTGMLMNLTELKRIIREEALLQLDHRNIDCDVPFFVDNPSTVENVAIYIWQQLVDQMPAAVRLYEIKLIETESNWVVFRGH